MLNFQFRKEKIETTPEMDAIRKAFAVIEFDPTGVILDANSAFLEAVGYGLEDIKGKHHSMFVEASERNGAAYRSLWQQLGAGVAMQDQVLRIARGGRQIWLQAAYTPIVDASGKVFKVIKFATDITAHKNVVADREGQIAAINKSQAVIEFDLTGNILHANANFLAATGYALEEIVGRHHRMFVDEETRNSAAYADFWAKLGRGDHDEGQYKRYGKGGRVIWIQASYSPILDALGKPWKVVKYASDITASKIAVAETNAVVAAAMNHDLTKRIATDGIAGDTLALCEGVNALMASFAQVVASVTATTSEVKNSSSEISAATGDLARRTEQQAASLEETAATTEELAASVKATSQAAVDAATIASEAMRSAETGGSIVGEAVEAMSRIESSSSRISDIVRVIDDIAFQTNLLALNAAVEAARAGEAGKGFAVVASEVRTLAQRSGGAAKDIFALISKSHAEVGQGVKLVRQAGEALTAILASSRKVAGTISDISTATSEQAQGIDEVSRTVANLDSITQANAAMVEQGAASAHGLSEKAGELHRVVAAFKIDQQAVSRPRVAPVTRPAPSPVAPVRRVANGGSVSGFQEF
jgi:methyl-accepting chemotaxis protein